MISNIVFILSIIYIMSSANYIITLCQNDSYHIRIFKQITKKEINKQNIYKNIIHILLVLYLIFSNNLMISLLLIIYYILMIVIYYSLNKKLIKKIKITNRIIRLYIIYISLITISFFLINFQIIYFQIFSIIFINMKIIYISLLISNYFEKLINIKYIKKARKKIKKYNPFVIGITGSCGKTSIKNYIYESIKDDFITYKSDKSYNTLKGLLITINNKLHSYDNLLVLEMGASHKNDILEITNIIKPNISIISEILPQHLSTFKTMDRLINEKMMIVKNTKDAGLIIANFENEIIRNKIDEYNIHNNNIISYGYSDLYCYQAKEISIYTDHLEFVIHSKYLNNDIKIKAKVIGKHNVLNLLATFIVLKIKGLSEERIKNVFQNITNYDNRLEIKKQNDLIILNDAYNSNINGFINALDHLALYNDYKKVLITPGIVDAGKMSEEINRKIAKKITQICDYCYLINNKNTIYYKSEFEKYKYFSYEIKQSFSDAFNKVKNKKMVVLIENDLTDFYYI